MIISSIIDKATGKEMLPTYKNRELDIPKCKFIKNKQLLITYMSGTYFKHEKVLKAVYPDKSRIEVETIKKNWVITE